MDRFGSRRHSPPFLARIDVRATKAGGKPTSRMRGEPMRRRFLPVVVPAALAASLVVTCPAAAGNGVSMKLGSTFTITGRTGSAPGKHTRAVGKVVLSGRWGTRPWHVLATTVTDGAGKYRFAITPRRRGTLTLRIAPPDHHPRRYVLHVS